MKITVLVRCEDSTQILVTAKNAEEGRGAAAKIATQPYVIGCRLRGMVAGKALCSHVARYQRGHVYMVPDEVGQHLISLKYAERYKEPA